MVQLEPAMAARVKALAKKDRRTVSNFVGGLIEKQLGFTEVVEEPQATYGAEIGVDAVAAELEKKRRSDAAKPGARRRAAPDSSSPKPGEKR